MTLPSCPQDQGWRKAIAYPAEDPSRVVPSSSILCEALILRKYNQNTWYDQNGPIIYTKNRGLPGIGLSSSELDAVKGYTADQTIEQTVEDDTQPGGPVERTIVYEAPFTKCDRKADYERACGVFEERGPA